MNMVEESYLVFAKQFSKLHAMEDAHKTDTSSVKHSNSFEQSRFDKNLKTSFIWFNKNLCKTKRSIRICNTGEQGYG